MGSVSDCLVRVNKGQDHRKYLGVSSGVSIEIFPNKLLYISMICYRLSFHPLPGYFKGHTAKYVLFFFYYPLLSRFFRRLSMLSSLD